jgi:hypothetical protein
MKVKINGSDSIIEGSVPEIIDFLTSELNPCKEKALAMYLKKIAYYYEVEVFVPDMTVLSSNFEYYTHFAYTLSLQVGHLILLEGGDYK